MAPKISICCFKIESDLIQSLYKYRTMSTAIGQSREDKCIHCEYVNTMYP